MFNPLISNPRRGPTVLAFVVCESADGWSLHAPGSTDEAIDDGSAPPLADGPWADDEHIIPAGAYDEARRALSQE